MYEGRVNRNDAAENKNMLFYLFNVQSDDNDPSGEEEFSGSTQDHQVCVCVSCFMSQWAVTYDTSLTSPLVLFTDSPTAEFQVSFSP